MCWATAPETSELFRTPLGEKPSPPCKESAFRVCLSDVSQVRAVRWRKASVSSTTCQGPHIKVGNFEASSKWCPQQLGMFCISDFQRWKVLLQKEILSPQPRLPSIRGKDQALMEVPGCLLVSPLLFGKGSPFPCLQEQTKRIRQVMLIVTGSTSSLSLLERLPPLSLCEQAESLRSFLCHSSETAFVYSVRECYTCYHLLCSITNHSDWKYKKWVVCQLP